MFSVSGVRKEKSLKGGVFYCTSHELRAEEREGNAGNGRVRTGKGGMLLVVTCDQQAVRVSRPA